MSFFHFCDAEQNRGHRGHLKELNATQSNFLDSMAEYAIVRRRTGAELFADTSGRPLTGRTVKAVFIFSA